MARWNILDAARRREAEPSPRREEPPTKSDAASPWVGRGGSDASTSEVERPKHLPKLRTIGLESGAGGIKIEAEATPSGLPKGAMADIGRFRTVDVQDLARFAYRGDQAHMRQGLENLRAQGLVKRNRVPRAPLGAKLVTLTGKDTDVRKRAVLERSKGFYHGLLSHGSSTTTRTYIRSTRKPQLKSGRRAVSRLRVRLDLS